MITFGGPWNNVGIGNHFFMYSYMRLLSENLNYKMIVPPMTFSERSGNHSQLVHNFKSILYGNDNTGNEIYSIDDGFSYANKNIDNAIEFFTDKKYHIVSSGYYQKYSYWKNYKNKVKNYFTDFISNEKRNNSDIAIHLRNSYQDSRFKLKPEYYLKSLEKFENGSVYIFADDIKRHDETLTLLNQYNPIIIDLNVPDTIMEFTKFNNIICSQGSFSFWVSFLSSANKIIWPITTVGPNNLNEWSLDYIVDDEDRYEFVYL